MDIRNERRVRKVVAYITDGPRLLVLKHRDFPEIGIEVPAGTVAPDEDLSAAVLREAWEETGLEDLEIVSYLGTADWYAHMFDQTHERHFFHLKTTKPSPQEWLHYEPDPSGPDKTPVAYNLFWVETGRAELFWDKGALLHMLCPARSNES